MPAPADIQPGALSREAPCPWCFHGPHRYLPCDNELPHGDVCPCTHAEEIGVDTALGGTP